MLIDFISGQLSQSNCYFYMSVWMLQLQDREGRVCVPSGPWFWCDDFVSCELAVLLTLVTVLPPMFSIILSCLLFHLFAVNGLDFQTIILGGSVGVLL